MLSTSVADAFAFIGKPYTKETERFARTFDKFFDLFNVRSLTEGIRKCKPNLCPYRNDEQSMDWLKASFLHTELISHYYCTMQWLESDFIAYLDEWEEAANQRDDLSVKDQQKLCISRETLEGLRFTGKHQFKLSP